MDLGSLTLFQMANRKMEWLGQRQTILSQNIANADTPNYRPSDLVPIDFSKELAKPGYVGMARTDEKHMRPDVQNVKTNLTNSAHFKGTLPDQAPNRVNTIRKPYEMSIDENGVILEEQMAKVGKVQSQYEMSTTLYNSYTKMLKLSLGKGR